MAQDGRPVYAAIERWLDKALITPELGERLREEVAESAEARTARMTQYVIAATGAVVLLIAAGVFLDWAWPRMDEAGRTGFLAAVGIAVHLWGVRLEVVRRWIPAALLMQTAGLGVVMTALVYSHQAWADVSAGGIGTGVAALLVPLVLAPRSFRANAVMPAVHLCFGLGFLAVFLDRATPIPDDQIVWFVDAVLVAASAVMVLVLKRDPRGQRHPWALNAFVAAVYAAAVLVAVTATGPMDMEGEVAYPLDAWWALLVGLTLWGIHRSPPGLRRGWFEDQLAYCLLIWIPLGFFTAMEAMDRDVIVGMVFVSGMGVVGFAYALRYRLGRMVTTSALAFIVGIWAWAVDTGGALGGVVGLGIAAALLFWLSGKVGSWGKRTPDGV
jgi:hypothetical protein